MGHHDLTPRELKVLTLVACGRTAEEIGSILDITSRTAAIHAQHAIFKLGASNSSDAVVVAIRQGLLVL
jgi:DNA-binding CsgD family transcriptional regulator